MPVNRMPGRNVGRPKGATEGTIKARHAIAMFVDGNVGRLNGWLDKIAKDSPIKAFECFMSVVEYHVPKLQRSEIEQTIKNDLADLPTSTINILINSLKLSLERDNVAKPDSLIDQQGSTVLEPDSVAALEADRLQPVSFEADSLSGLETVNLLEQSQVDESLIGYQGKKTFRDPPPSPLQPPNRAIEVPVFPIKNERHTDDRITGDGETKPRTTAENSGGSQPSRKTKTNSRSAITSEDPQVGDVSSLL